MKSYLTIELCFCAIEPLEQIFIFREVFIFRTCVRFHDPALIVRGFYASIDIASKTFRK